MRLPRTGCGPGIWNRCGIRLNCQVSRPVFRHLVDLVVNTLLYLDQYEPFLNQSVEKLLELQKQNEPTSQESKPPKPQLSIRGFAGLPPDSWVLSAGWNLEPVTLAESRSGGCPEP